MIFLHYEHYNWIEWNLILSEVVEEIAVRFCF